jgi:hypothetical protein
MPVVGENPVDDSPMIAGDTSPFQLVRSVPLNKAVKPAGGTLSGCSSQPGWSAAWTIAPP